MIRIGMEAAQLRQWSSRQRLAALKRIIPKRKVTAALRRTGCGQNYCPRTPDGFMIWFVVALGLFCNDCYRQIYRWMVPWKKADVPGRTTLCEARKRLGVAPLVRLAAEVIKLLATPQMPGAFYCEMRLMAVDGFVVDLPDTPDNDRVFGRPGNQKSPGAFPQAQVLGLVEAGTHVFWRWLIKGCQVGEFRMLKPLLKKLQSGMLLMWDRGFTSFELVKQTLDRKAQLLAHWKNNRILPPRRVLSDGSYLARIYANDSDRRADRNGIDVRIIEYTLDDPARPGCGEKHRLLTTLLDEKLHPALTLVELYHVRWEEELAIDELKTHEMERPVLRSQTPAGVVQEIYGLMLGHYVVRTLMCEAAGRVPTSPLRMSFTGTLKILRCRLPECPQSPKARQQWWNRLLEEITEEQIPCRRNRINPRVIKRQQCQWPTKRPHHRKCAQPTRPFRDSVVLRR
jgi:Insertion element 4 transposase N-terminal/Transposase DDE domain